MIDFPKDLTPIDRPVGVAPPAKDKEKENEKVFPLADGSYYARLQSGIIFALSRLVLRVTGADRATRTISGDLLDRDGQWLSSFVGSHLDYDKRARLWRAPLQIIAVDEAKAARWRSMALRLDLPGTRQWRATDMVLHVFRDAFAQRDGDPYRFSTIRDVGLPLDAQARLPEKGEAAQRRGQRRIDIHVGVLDDPERHDPPATMRDRPDRGSVWGGVFADADLIGHLAGAGVTAGVAAVRDLAFEPDEATGGWTDRELHDHMAALLPRIDGPARRRSPAAPWPVALLIARAYGGAAPEAPSPRVIATMFDKRSIPSDGPREGAALFTDAFAELLRFAPAPKGTTSAAWEKRLRTWVVVHELGHVFNLLHSDETALRSGFQDRSEPAALSWMNSPGFYPLGQAAPNKTTNARRAAFYEFFEKFWPVGKSPAGFSPVELLHLRHGAYPDVVPGGSSRFPEPSPARDDSSSAFAMPGGQSLLDIDFVHDEPSRSGGGEPQLSPFGAAVVTIAAPTTSAAMLRSDLRPGSAALRVLVQFEDESPVEWTPLAQSCELVGPLLIQPRQSLRLVVRPGYAGGRWLTGRPGAYTLHVEMLSPVDGRWLRRSRPFTLPRAPWADACTKHSGVLTALGGSGAAYLRHPAARLEDVRRNFVGCRTLGADLDYLCGISGIASGRAGHVEAGIAQLGTWVERLGPATSRSTPRSLPELEECLERAAQDSGNPIAPLAQSAAASCRRHARGPATSAP